MQSNPLYLVDSYKQSVAGQVLAVQTEGTEVRVMLDQTVFYPMGGGQPTDQGQLSYTGQTAEVYQVMVKDGEIWHYLKTATPPSVGDKVEGQINWERRYKHMRLHSAGHVVDFAMYLLGYSPITLVPMKGDHGKKPYIVYQGLVDHDITAELAAKANELVTQNLTFSWEFEPLEKLQAEAIYLQPGLPADKPLRALRLEGVGAVADGGTQVHQTGEVGEIVVGAVEQIEGNTVVHYALKA